jgi:hypothetical protein
MPLVIFEPMPLVAGEMSTPPRALLMAGATPFIAGTTFNQALPMEMPPAVPMISLRSLQNGRAGP